MTQTKINPTLISIPSVLFLLMNTSLNSKIALQSHRTTGLAVGFATAAADSPSRIFRRRQVQLIHRHGDRSPITPLRDEEYWQKQLVPDSTLEGISSNTELISDATCANYHVANGRCPFGKLTELGLFQMIKLGTQLREEFVEPEELSSLQPDPTGRWVRPFLFTKDTPLDPSRIRILSTNFPRTIQSVQGLLVGLFPDGTPGTTIPIDIRHTDWILPDPIPRQTTEQATLEHTLSQRQHMKDREAELASLAVKATEALQDLLADDAHTMAFGTPQDTATDEECIEIEPLSWNQLAEIIKCLSVRDRLPAAITADTQDTIIQHAAWRWFETFSHPRVAHLATGKLARTLLTGCVLSSREAPLLTVWSAHDSVLIACLCAFRLEQPVEWPEYGSYLMIEALVEEDSPETTATATTWIRFSLNGQVLRTHWSDEGEEPTDMIPLQELLDKMAVEPPAAATV